MSSVTHTSPYRSAVEVAVAAAEVEVEGPHLAHSPASATLDSQAWATARDLCVRAVTAGRIATKAARVVSARIAMATHLDALALALVAVAVEGLPHLPHLPQSAAPAHLDLQAWATATVLCARAVTAGRIATRAAQVVSARIVMVTHLDAVLVLAAEVVVVVVAVAVAVDHHARRDTWVPSPVMVPMVPAVLLNPTAAMTALTASAMEANLRNLHALISTGNISFYSY